MMCQHSKKLDSFFISGSRSEFISKNNFLAIIVTVYCKKKISVVYESTICHMLLSHLLNHFSKFILWPVILHWVNRPPGQYSCSLCHVTLRIPSIYSKGV